MAIVDTKSRVVLVVDDDEDLRRELRDVLEADGYFVLEASDGRDALRTLRMAVAGLIRLIVLDLAMPNMSGWELVDVLRGDSRFSRIPILVTSGIPVHGDASGIGATLSWVRKPFGQDALLAAVEDALREPSASDLRERERPSKPSARQCLPSRPDR